MIVAVVQARMSSSRLPGKVLKPVLGRPMILRQLERIRRSELVDRILVATSDEASDAVLADTVVDAGYPCFRGSLENVLQRVTQAATIYSPQLVVRLTADCPLTDPSVIDDAIRLQQFGRYDYVSNTQERTYPHGLDVEVMTMAALQRADNDATSSYEREHVTPYLYQQANRFLVGQLLRTPALDHLRWTVDHAEDFALIESIYWQLYPKNDCFATADVLRLLERNPQLTTINALRNEALEVESFGIIR